MIGNDNSGLHFYLCESKFKYAIEDDESTTGYRYATLEAENGAFHQIIHPNARLHSAASQIFQQLHDRQGSAASVTTRLMRNGMCSPTNWGTECNCGYTQYD